MVSQRFPQEQWTSDPLCGSIPGSQTRSLRCRNSRLGRPYNMHRTPDRSAKGPCSDRHNPAFPWVQCKCPRRTPRSDRRPWMPRASSPVLAFRRPDGSPARGYLRRASGGLGTDPGFQVVPERTRCALRPRNGCGEETMAWPLRQPAPPPRYASSNSPEDSLSSPGNALWRGTPPAMVTRPSSFRRKALILATSVMVREERATPGTEKRACARRSAWTGTALQLRLFFRNSRMA